VRPVYHIQNHTCQVTLLQPARHDTVLGQPSSLRSLWRALQSGRAKSAVLPRLPPSLGPNSGYTWSVLCPVGGPGQRCCPAYLPLWGLIAAIPGACSAEWAGQVSGAAPPSACNAASLGTAPVPGVRSIVSLILFLRLKYSITFYIHYFFSFGVRGIFCCPYMIFTANSTNIWSTLCIQLLIFKKILQTLQNN
jgi:hypothetical protein